jgi:hypothetical protein
VPIAGGDDYGDDRGMVAVQHHQWQTIAGLTSKCPYIRRKWRVLK